MIKILLLPSSSRSAKVSRSHEVGVQRARLIVDIAGELTGPGPGLVVMHAAASSLVQLQALLASEQPDLVHVLAAPPQHPPQSGESADGAGSAPVWEIDHDGSDSSFTDRITTLFTGLPKAVRWVLCDGCADSQQAAAMAQLVDCVIGTPARLLGEPTTEFLRCLYLELARGKSAQDAFAAAQRGLHEQQVEAALLAVLTTRHTNESAVFTPTDAAPATPLGVSQSPVVFREPAVSPMPSETADSSLPAPSSVASSSAESAQILATSPVVSRQLNAGFYLGSDRVPESEPLWLVKTTYRLAVNVGTPWEPGQNKVGLPEQLRAWVFQLLDSVELDVVARSQDLRVAPAAQKLRLPKSGDSQLVFFALELERAGRQSISVELLYQGQLLQTLCIDVTVATAPGLPPPEGPIAAQESHLTFTHTAELTAELLGTLRDRPRG